MFNKIKIGEVATIATILLFIIGGINWLILDTIKVPLEHISIIEKKVDKIENKVDRLDSDVRSTVYNISTSNKDCDKNK